jgi:PAS domain S-box-containing protein
MANLVDSKIEHTSMNSLQLDSRTESRFEAIFNHVNEGILIANHLGEIILMNPRGLQMFGYTMDELRKQLVEALIPKEFTERHVDYREAYMRMPVKRPMGKNLTLQGLRKDGTRFPLEISLSYYESAEGMFAIAFIIDITERFDQQEKIKKINEELKALNENLEKKVGERTLVLKEALHELENSRDSLAESLEKEKELNEMKSRFISMASHEFRTPLATILSSTTLIEKYLLTEEQSKREKHIHRIKNAVSGLTEILNDFLSIGRLEEGKVSSRPMELDVKYLLEEIISELQPLCRTGQVISLEYQGTTQATIDKQIFRNVLINLLSNAIKFSPDDAEIKVLCKHEQALLELHVIDQGMGIPEEEQKHLFGRFFRGRNAQNIQGTGLGLNIVAKYLEILGGTITFKSVLEEGTTFTLSIPTNNTEEL